MGDGRGFESAGGSKGGSPYEGVAPKLSQEALERSEETRRPIRGGYGEVAPIFNNPPQQQQPNPYDPAPSTRVPIRPGYGEVAPIGPGGGTQPQQPGGAEAPPRFGDRTIPGVDPNDPWRRDAGGSGNGGRTSQQEAARQAWIENQNWKHFVKLELIGGTSGYLWGGPLANGMSHGAKWYLSRSDGFLNWAKGKNMGWAESPIVWGQKGAQWWETNHGVRTGNGPLRDLKAMESEVLTKLDDMAKKLEPEVERITRKMVSGSGEAALTAEEQSVLRLHQFLQERNMGALPEGAAKLLTAEEQAAIKHFQDVTRLLSGAQLNPAEVMKHIEALEAQAVSGRVMESIAQRLQPQVDDLLKKAGQPGAVLTEAEQAIIDAHKMLKSGAKGTLPAGVLTEAEMLAVVTHRNNMELVQRLGSEQAFKGLNVADVKAAILKAGEANTRIDEIVKRLAPQAEGLAQKVKTGVLTAEEQAILNKYNYLKGATEVIPKGILTAEEEALISQRTLVRGRIASLESELKATPRGFKAGLGNFAKGMMVIAGAQLVEDKLDKIFFGKDHGNKPSWYTDSILMPASLLLPGGWLKKGAAMVGTHMLGKWLDNQFPANKNVPEFTRLLRPNGVEAFAVAGAFLIPMRAETFKRRLAYVGAAWAGSKVLNLFIENRTPQEMATDAIEDWKRDKTERTAGSMNETIDGFKSLSKAEEGSVERYRDNWLGWDSAKRTHTEDPLNGYRGAAMLLTAVGEASLDMGTRVSKGNGSPTAGIIEMINPFSNNSRKYDYILEGYNLDLGGVAMKNLAGARVSINRAKSFTEELLKKDPNATLRGTKVDRGEIEDLEKVGRRVDAQLEKIYGKHDIHGAHKEVADWLRKLNQHDAAKKIRDPIKASLQNPGTTDPRYVAKLYRDLALIDLAWGSVKVGHNGIGSGADGMTADMFYREAASALQQARALDPSNEDLTQLEAILKELSGIIPEKIDAQRSSPSANPLNVDDGLYKK